MSEQWQQGYRRMPRKAGPERKHFGGEGGMITETQNGVVSYYWKCMYCGWKVGGKYFQNKKARVHLSGDPDLRNGLITEVCQKAPEVVKQEFALLERQKRVEQQQLVASRKRALELLSMSKTKHKKQKSLPFQRAVVPNDVVDDAWALAFFGLDIAPSKISSLLFRDAIATTIKAKSG